MEKLERSEEFIQSKKELIDSFSNIDEGFCIYGSENYTPLQMLHEVTYETKVGVEQIEMFMRTKEKIEKIRLKNK
jgi:hypothetical protein